MGLEVRSTHEDTAKNKTQMSPQPIPTKGLEVRSTREDTIENII